MLTTLVTARTNAERMAVPVATATLRMAPHTASTMLRKVSLFFHSSTTAPTTRATAATTARIGQMAAAQATMVALPARVVTAV